MEQHKVLGFVGGFLPGFRYGGPISSIAAISLLMKDSDIDFRVITPDRDLGVNEPYESIVAGQWTRIADHNVFYVPAGLNAVFSLLRLLIRSRGCSIYLNSIFHVYYSIFPLIVLRILKALGRPYHLIIAPRSELMSEVIRPKVFKKTSFLYTAKLFGLFKGAVFHGTSEQEVEDLERWFPSNKICYIQNPVYENEVFMSRSPLDYVPDPTIDMEDKENLSLIFLSRISPKKNLQFLLNVLAEVDFNFHLDIWGPPEDPSYVAECNALIVARQLKDRVTFRGEIEKNLVIPLMAKYDLFCLPSKGENFGHVIAESLKAGTVPVISTHTPWTGAQNGTSLSALCLKEPIWRRKLEELFRVKQRDGLRSYKRDAEQIYLTANNNKLLRERYLNLFRNRI